jgi:hypothetical protein
MIVPERRADESIFVGQEHGGTNGRIGDKEGVGLADVWAESLQILFQTQYSLSVFITAWLIDHRPAVGRQAHAAVMYTAAAVQTQEKKDKK